MGEGEISGIRGNSLVIRGIPDIKTFICFYHFARVLNSGQIFCLLL